MTQPEWLRPLADGMAEALSDAALPHALGGRSGRTAAVLILLAEGPDGPEVLLTQRSADLRSHPGQPAFPGGATDEGDESPAATALREAAEEVGLDPSGVDVVATLPTLFLAPSEFVVRPVLAWWREVSDVAPVDPAETAGVFRVPVRDLADPANRVLYLHPRSGWVGPAFRVHGMFVWGFTAGLLDALLAVGGWERPWREGATVTDIGPRTGDAGTGWDDPEVPILSDPPG